MKKKHFYIIAVTIILYLISIIIGLFKLTNWNIVINCVSAIAFVISIRIIAGNFSNITFLFCIFSIIYGLSGPITVQYGEGLGELFGNNFEIDIFLIVYDLSNIGFLMGVLFYRLLNKKKDNSKLKNILNIHRKKYIYLAILCMGLCSSFTIIDFIRVGGISTLMKGKAVYQAAISALTGTLPSDIFACISVELCSLYIILCKENRKNKNWILILITVIIFIPFLAVNLFLGKRGILLSLILITFLTFTFFTPIIKISKKLIIIGIIVYLIMTFLYANRAIMSMLINDRETFKKIAFSKERIEKALNPGSSEFGAAFGNFNKLYTNKDYQFKFGETYLRGLVIWIPSFMYIGEKPQQITYEFRDSYFPSEAKRSSIAGTAFSSILEAYWNFGYLGVFVIYFMVAYLLQKLDLYWKNYSEFSFLLYILISPFLISFHRSALGDIISNIILKALALLVFVYIPLKYTKTKQALEE